MEPGIWSLIVNKLSLFWTELGAFQDIIILAIPVIAWLIREPVANGLLQVISSISKGLGFSIGEDVKSSLGPATRVLLVTSGILITNELMQIPEPLFSIVDKFLVSICVVAVFSANYSLCIYIPDLLPAKKQTSAHDRASMIVRIVQFAVVFLGIAAVIKVWGIDVGPTLTGMGVAGAGVALAAQDYIKNLMGGFSNAAERRFRVGELIRVEGLVEGVVERVDLRSTVIRRLDTAPVHVPNSDLANAAIINLDRRVYRRIYWKISLTYSSSVETLREISQRVEQYIHDSDYFVTDDNVIQMVRIDSFNDSSIDMLVYCFTRSRLYRDYLDAKNDLALAIKTIVMESDGDFAFPTRSIFIEASDTAGPAEFIAANVEN